MSMTDTLAPLVSAPWFDRHGKYSSVRPLPGLCPKVLYSLRYASAGLMKLEYREFLASCSGLAGTALGHIDFTGCWYPIEACAVFYPCITLAVDNESRRWITEISEEGLPGRVWCLFNDPQVAVYVSEDLAAFIATLRDRTRDGRMSSWLEDLTAQAQAIWTYRRDFALRPFQAVDSDPKVTAWLKSLPLDAYIYDLRELKAARGWPYGLAGPTARLYRCGSLPVFAVAAPYSDGSRAYDPENSFHPRSGPHLTGHVIPLPVRQGIRVVAQGRFTHDVELQRCA